MFDDPKKELQRLQDELLAAEEEEWDDLSDIQDLLDDYEEEDSVESLLQEFGADAEEEPRYQNYANGYGRRPARPVYEEEAVPELDDDAVLYREDARTKKKAKKEKKEKGIGCLVFLAVLETMGILAIAAWWAVMLL